LRIAQAPFGLEVGEHRHHDLTVDVVDDHQREEDREDRPLRTEAMSVDREDR
jgi:hypothetical protein